MKNLKYITLFALLFSLNVFPAPQSLRPSPKPAPALSVGTMAEF